MRCGCPQCGAYMIQADDLELGCICPDCLYRCQACLGTKSVISREELQKRKKDPSFDARSFFGK